MKKRHLKTYVKKSISAFLALSLFCFLPAGSIRAEESGGYGTDWPLMTGTSTFGSSNMDFYYGVAATDNGYIAVGGSAINVIDGDFAEYNMTGTGAGGFIVGYTGSGTSAAISWVKAFKAGTDNRSIFSDICRLSDGSYVVVGNSTFQDLSGSDEGTTLKDNAGNTYSVSNYTRNQSVSYNNGILIHLDASGSILSMQGIGGAKDDRALSVSATNDGGFIVSGDTKSTDGDFLNIPNTSASGAAYVAKYSSSFSKEWIKCYASMDIKNVKQASDGGYLIAGNSKPATKAGSVTLSDSSGNTVTTYSGPLNGGADAIIFKTDTDGDISYINRTGGTRIDIYSYIIPTSDGGYLAVGASASDDHDMADAQGNSLRHATDTYTGGVVTVDGYDAIIVKYAADGSREWYKNYGGSGTDNKFYSVLQKSDGSYIVSGITNSTDGDILKADNSNNGAFDFWLLAFSADGEITNSMLLGGSNDDQQNTTLNYGHNTMVDTGTSYVLVGKSASSSGAFTRTLGTGDACIVFFSYDYDGDGIPNSLDYYPNDASLSLPPAGALDLNAAPVKIAGDGTSDSASISSSNLFVADNGSPLTASDIYAVRTSNASFNVPLGLMNYLFETNGVDNVIFNAQISSKNVSTSGSENFVTAFELDITDKDGNPLTSISFGGNIQVSFTIPASEAANYDSAKTTALYYIADDGTRTEIPGASFVKNSDGSITVTFQTSHFSTYAIIQSEAAATAVNNPNNSDNPGGTTLTSSSVGTGDAGTGIYPWIMVIAALCIIGVVVSLVYRNRKSRTI